MHRKTVKSSQSYKLENQDNENKNLSRTSAMISDQMLREIIVHC